MPNESQSDLANEFGEGVENLPASVDRAAVRRMQVVAKVLDDSIRVPGTKYRVGIDPILSALPVAGDIIGGGFSMYIVLESARLGVSYITLLRMMANVALDVAGGSIPYVGDVFDAAWKANKRNLELALNDLAKQYGAQEDHGEAISIEVE
ncbi:MAG: DUF4112 domain-containing protein [Halobacteriaceae archaeon]